MALNIGNPSLLRTAAKGLATKAAVQQAAVSGSLKIDKVRSGAVIVSVDNNEPVSRIGVFLRAGARHSPIVGLSHVLQHCGSGGLSSLERTGLNMVRTAEQLGATKALSVGREVAMYSMSSFRDSVDETMSILSSVTSNADYARHEFPNDIEMVRLKASTNVSPLAQVRDMAVKAAYRAQPMGNSVYTPSYNAEKITAEQVNDFVRETHGASGLVVVGTGVDHEVLYESASVLGLQDGGVVGGNSSPAKYLGGDLRVETGGASTALVVAAEGAKYGSANSYVLMVAVELLGNGNCLSFAEGSTGLLNSLKKDKSGMSMAGFTENWSDTGLFGVAVECFATDSQQAVKSIVSALKNMSVKEAEVAAAKTSVISKILGAAYGSKEVERIGMQMLLTGEHQSLEDTVKAVEAVSAAAVNKVVAEAFKGKISIAALGNVNDVPYADTL